MAYTEQFKQMRNATYEQLFTSSKAGKYPYPFSLINKVHPLILPNNLKFLDALYICMRRVDDYADGDTPSPDDEGKKLDYLERKIAVVKNNNEPVGDVEKIMSHSFSKIRDKVGTNVERIVRESSTRVLNSIIFDVKRRLSFINSGKLMVSSGSDMTGYLLNMELYGVFQVCITLLEKGPVDIDEKFKLLVTTARGNYYFLRDIIEDIAEGLLNIPLEDLGSDLSENKLNEFQEQCSSYLGELERPYSDLQSQILLLQNAPISIQKWILAQLESGEELLAKYKTEISSRNLRLTTRLFLYFFYYRPAYAFFKKFGKQWEKLDSCKQKCKGVLGKEI